MNRPSARDIRFLLAVYAAFLRTLIPRRNN